MTQHLLRFLPALAVVSATLCTRVRGSSRSVANAIELLDVTGEGECPSKSTGRQPTLEADSVAIARYLAAHDLTLAKIAARRGPYYSVMSRAAGHSRRALFNLRVCGDSIVLLNKADDVGDYAPTLVSWVTVRDSTVDGLLITYDTPIEGDVGTVIYSLHDSDLSLVFTDAQGVCKPAELRDLNGDGQPELLVYSGDLSKGDCTNLCHITLRDRFDMVPAWVEVRRWTGKDWVRATDGEYRAFYRRLAETYSQMADWLTTGSEHEHCQNMPWLPDAEPFNQWAAQARALVR
jgi:hypothetical protein